jgi:prepilin-type N-terminal cleavage/methylation domain-containing protein
MHSGFAQQKSRAAGFTLIEMLVVLLIVGMTTTLLFQMLSQTFRMQRYAGIQITDARQGTMEADWFRQLVNGLQPDYAGAKNVFSGAARKLTGLSNNPLTTDYGAPVPITLVLAYDADNDLTRLFYGPETDGTPVMAWHHDIGRLVYVDAAGDNHDTWPPAMGLWPQLPQAIRLEFEEEQGPRVIVGAPRGPIEPAPRVGDVAGSALPQ